MSNTDGIFASMGSRADLLETGCELYKEMVYQDIETGQNPMLDGKPISLVLVRAVRHVHQQETIDLDGVVFESVVIRPLDSSESEDPVISRDGNFSGAVPKNVSDLRNETRRNIDDLCFDEYMNLNGILLPSTVAIEYVGYDEDEEVVSHMNTFDEEINALLATRATKLANKLRDILSINGINELPRYNIVSNIQGGDEFDIGFAPIIDSRLPLNGNEPTEFVREYYLSMLRQASNLVSIEEDLIASGRSVDQIDDAEREKNSCIEAAQLAFAILNSRNSNNPDL